MSITRFFLTFFVFLLSSSWVLAQDIEAKGLFKNAAMLQISGKPRMLKVGQRSPEGILLVSASPRQAVIEVKGVQRQIGLSQRISSNYSAVERRKVTIALDSRRQYITTALINGRRAKVLVDTGATSMGLSGRHARQLGITDYQQGVPGRVITASGEVPAYRVTLGSVSVGGIKVSHVDASVVEGDYPETILLGMSYLKHVEMAEQNGSMVLQAKF